MFLPASERQLPSQPSLSGSAFSRLSLRASQCVEGPGSANVTCHLPHSLRRNSRVEGDAPWDRERICPDFLTLPVGRAKGNWQLGSTEKCVCENSEPLAAICGGRVIVQV